MIGVVVGILPVGLLPVLPCWPSTLLIACCAMLFLLHRGTSGCFFSGAALGVAIGVVHGHQLMEARLVDECNGLALSLRGHVDSLPRRTVMEDGTPRQRFEFQVYPSASTHCGKLRRVLLSYYGPESIEPGQQWRFNARMKKPWGLANPGSFNMQAWFALTRIDAVGSINTGSARRLGIQNGIGTSFNRLRQQISGRIESLVLGDESRAILRAVTVADKSGIDARLWMLMQRLGINHLTVISGLHVGMVAGAGFLLGGLGGRLLQLAGIPALWLGSLTALALAVFYSALAGFSVATQRALCMLVCFILAHILGRDSGSANNLFIAGLVVLLLNPLAALGSGFWLSFTAVGALLWLGRWRLRGGLPARLCATHGFMSLVMLPLGSWWFGGASLVAAPANLLMIPLVGLFVVPLALLASLFFLLELPGDMFLWELAAWPLEMLMAPVRDIVDGAQHWIYIQNAPPAAAVGLALGAVSLLVIPSGWRLRSVALAMAVPLWLPVKRDFAADPAVTRVAVLDVGQGTSVVVYSARRALLYDTGGGDPAGLNMARSVVLPFLRHRGIAELDTLVLSHGDRDHSAGARSVLRALPAERVRYGSTVPGLSAGLPCRAGEAWRWPGGQEFQFLSPALEAGLTSNNASCVLRITLGEYVLLLPGDIESERERELVRYWGNDLRSDWLHAAHHGSKTSTSLAWLKHVLPQQVIISSGNANRFGHPHPEVVKRLEESGARLWQTDREGALEYELVPGRAPVLRRYRTEQHRFWM
jgi:competence protein ComEC